MPPRLNAALAAFQQGKFAEARALAVGELEQHGGSPQLQHLLGLIECRLGRFAAGIDWLRSASRADPGNVAFRVMLVRALVDDGRPQEALDVALRPAGASDPELALWHARAEAADAADRPDIAADSWGRLCAANPGDWRAWINLGRSFLALDRFDEAEAAYRSALSLEWRPEAVRQLGLVYERVNKNERLKQLLDQAEERGIERRCIADLRATAELRDGHPARAREWLDAGEAGDDLVRWHRLHARVADALGDSAAAFEATVSMNRAAPGFEDWRDQAKTYRADLLRTAQSIDRRWAECLPRLPQERCPTFLLGFPRSGTTLLDTFLMGHPDILVIEEKGLLARAVQAAGPIEQLVHVEPAQLIRIREAYLDQLDREVGNRTAHVVIDKAPLNMLLAPLIHVLFEGAPIIFAQRHPCDATLSGFMQSFAPNLAMANFLEIADSAAFYDACMKLWSASLEALPLRVHPVVYEELLLDPAAVLLPVLEFVGLSWDDRVLDHRATAASRGVLTNTSYDQITRPLTTEPLGRWQRYRAQLEPVLPLLLPWARKLGYRGE